jgi:RNA polymerase sigma factor (sigma-70 family)
MISRKEAESLMARLIHLRKRVRKYKTPNAIRKYQTHQKLCMEKFKYLITMHTDKYRGFFNYEDLNQEGFEALLKAMKNYNPEKGSFFWWAHKYIETRISRTANLHTTIRYPLKYAKAHPPHKEANLPTIIETRFCPDISLENTEIRSIIQKSMKRLNKEQKKVVKLAFGFTGDKPMSINKICKKMKISRINCIKSINGALDILKQHIRI